MQLWNSYRFENIDQILGDWDIAQNLYCSLIWALPFCSKGGCFSIRSFKVRIDMYCISSCICLHGPITASLSLKHTKTLEQNPSSLRFQLKPSPSNPFRLTPFPPLLTRHKFPSIFTPTLSSRSLQLIIMVRRWFTLSDGLYVNGRRKIR